MYESLILVFLSELWEASKLQPPPSGEKRVLPKNHLRGQNLHKQCEVIYAIVLCIYINVGNTIN